MANQDDIWKMHTSGMSIESVIGDYEKPALYQLELSKLINSENKDGLIAEIGCETGVSSMLLKDDFTKILVDLNPEAINLAKGAFKALNKEASFYVEDMFKMSFPDESVDIIFNAGVLEHFEFSERLKAIKEYSRILKHGGVMYLGVPNHYCAPYRLAYLIRSSLGKWGYPSENKIYDFTKEVKEISGIEQEKRYVLAKNNICRWLDFFPLLQRLFEWLDYIFKYEGYLTVIKIKKTD